MGAAGGYCSKEDCKAQHGLGFCCKPMRMAQSDSAQDLSESCGCSRTRENPTFAKEFIDFWADQRGLVEGRKRTALADRLLSASDRGPIERDLGAAFASVLHAASSEWWRKKKHLKHCRSGRISRA